jgi:hypothetical protein
MTTAAEDKVTEKEAAKAALQAREKEIAEKEKSLNEGREGKGTRVMVGMTRGRNPQMISYEAFDESQPLTLPTTLAEFMEISKVNDEKVIVSYLIDGFNSAKYSEASDPVSEFVESTWTADVAKNFKAVVKNYATACSLSIEDAVKLVKPLFLTGLANVKTDK